MLVIDTNEISLLVYDKYSWHSFRNLVKIRFFEKLNFQGNFHCKINKISDTFLG